MNYQLSTIALEPQALDYRVLMPQGIIGFSELKLYTLRPLDPTVDNSLFWELTNVEEADLSFILLHILDFKVGETFINPEDLETSLKPMNVGLNECKVFSIISVESDENQRKTITANIRAPFIYHVPTNKAWQVVLADKNYPIAQVI